ncbi:MAG: tetraacyldisaccharide 4'-kinase [Alphaproteobacteria bacterium]
MKTPEFWKTKNNISKALKPLGDVYNYFTQKRIAKAPEYIAPIPVICIGNITAGGTGKTPVAISISKMLERPFFISRGYGGKLKEAVVDIKKHKASDVGDEPMLLAQHAPTIINANRAISAQKAVEMEAKYIIMDDGLQNPKLQKTLSFVVIDGEYGFGNFEFIPAGPMREKQIRADAVIIIGNDKFNLGKKIKKPIFYGTIAPKKPEGGARNVKAFAGIGRPQKFYNSLRECGFGILKTFDFPDHHQYSIADLDAIKREAQGFEVWTTAKDFIKIPKSHQKFFNVLEIEIKWQDEQALKDFILEKTK